jgi:hypothetical protein
MVWQHYADEAYAPENEALFENQVDIDDYEDRGPPQPMDFEDWCEWFSVDLLNMWMSLRTYGQEASTSAYILTHAEFNDFCHFCYQFSRGYPSRLPS